MPEPLGDGLTALLVAAALVVAVPVGLLPVPVGLLPVPVGLLPEPLGLVDGVVDAPGLVVAAAAHPSNK